MALCSSNLPDRTINSAAIGSNQPRKVRLVAKVRGCTDQEAEFPSGFPWISVSKPRGEASEPVTVSFGDKSGSRKDSYEVDYCYEQSEDNELVFSREVKPLISGVLDGRNATVIAYGARGSGKTSLIQGSIEKPGLAALAMVEILSVAEENGKSVTMSFYEVFQDRVCDLLDSKQQVVFVLEDKQGKIQLKGLSQVPVKSVSDFQKLYAGFGSRKPAQKAAIELPHRGHKGLIVHLSSPNEKLDTLATGKMNFVDLAGYEDVRRKSGEGLSVVEQSKVNKSIYALLNVVHALSGNEKHVPYRESKLTRILQDSLGRASKVLMIACLNPTFCQDTMNMVNLASRSCQKISRSVFDSTKKIHNVTRPMMVSSKKSHIPRTVSATAKKQASSRVPLSEKKVNVGTAFAVKGRKLFDEAGDFSSSNKESSVLDNLSTVETVVKEEGKPIETVTDITVSGEENTFPDVLEQTEPNFIAEKDNPSTKSRNVQVFSSETNETIHKPQSAQFTPTVGKDVSEYPKDHPKEVTPCIDVSTDTKSSSPAQEGQIIAKDNNSSLVDDDKSPPISARLRELSNSLRALCSATPFSMKTAEKDDAPLVSTNILEPKTPVVEQSAIMEDRWNVKNVNSPWTFSTRNSGMKNSLVQDYLRFLNTAEKEDLKKLKGIGEKRATYILEMREESPEPFKNLDDLKYIGLSGKQIKDLMKKEVGGLFDD